MRLRGRTRLGGVVVVKLIQRSSVLRLSCGEARAELTNERIALNDALGKRILALAIVTRFGLDVARFILGVTRLDRDQRVALMRGVLHRAGERRAQLAHGLDVRNAVLHHLRREAS